MINTLSYIPVDLEKTFNLCIQFREDTYQCSFQNLKGCSDQVEFNGEKYGKYLRSYKPEGLRHIVYKGGIIGQLEFKLMPTNPKIGYINLIYVAQSYRGRGVAEKAMNFVMEYFKNNSCEEVMLSVSRTNQRAIKYYLKHGFQFRKKSIKDPLVDVYSHNI